MRLLNKRRRKGPTGCDLAYEERQWMPGPRGQAVFTDPEELERLIKEIEEAVLRWRMEHARPCPWAGEE